MADTPACPTCGQHRGERLAWERDCDDPWHSDPDPQPSGGSDGLSEGGRAKQDVVPCEGSTAPGDGALTTCKAAHMPDHPLAESEHEGLRKRKEIMSLPTYRGEPSPPSESPEPRGKWTIYVCPQHGKVNNLRCPFQTCRQLCASVEVVEASTLTALEEDARIQQTHLKLKFEQAEARADRAGARAEEAEEGLRLIEQHATLDLKERGVREAERYQGIARDSLARAALAHARSEEGPALPDKEGGE